MATAPRDLDARPAPLEARFEVQDERDRDAARRRLIVRWIVGIALFTLLFNVLIVAVRAVSGGPGGPTSSSFATGPDGLAAYAELLERFEYPVSRLRAPLADADLDPQDTVVLLDPGGLEEDQVATLRSFIAEGGRLIAGGTLPDAWLDPLLEDAPRWTFVGAGSARPVAPVPEVADVEEVENAGLGSWEEPAGTLPALASDDLTIMTVAQRGAGRVVLLADASMVQNRLLGEADNAALGVAMAGAGGREVVFIESVHGYERAVGWGAVPDRWRWTVYGLTGALLLYMAARGRRLGPPEPESRPLGPPRRDYVDAMGAILARSRRPAEAAAPVQTAARRRVALLAGLEPEVNDDEFRRAALRLGLTEQEASALLHRASTDDQLVASGRALAKLQRGPSRPRPAPDASVHEEDR